MCRRVSVDRLLLESREQKGTVTLLKKEKERREIETGRRRERETKLRRSLNSS